MRGIPSCLAGPPLTPPPGGRDHQLGLRGADPPSPLSSPGPQRLAGPARASVPGNTLAQNYIRLKVSIFCAILLPDLIVHLWQCLYTSPAQDHSVAPATGVRQRCNLEISGSEPASAREGRPLSALPPPPPRPSPTPRVLLPSEGLPGSHGPGGKPKSHLVT